MCHRNTNVLCVRERAMYVCPKNTLLSLNVRVSDKYISISLTHRTSQRVRRLQVSSEFEKSVSGFCARGGEVGGGQEMGGIYRGLDVVKLLFAQVCCSVLQCVAVCCSVFQRVVSSVLQCVAVCCSVLQCVAV